MSDSNMRSSHALVVGTAGHIDHGKTSLIYTLTGIDTDRLKEEKLRGISIDLGFAQMQLPEDVSISFIDVPGHERFVRNMLAGAAGMEAVMLIVAANESVMPQTREHFEICRLLGLRHGLVVLTKIDIATPEQITQARKDIQRLVAGSFLASSPVVEFSAVNQSGLADLKHHLTILSKLETARDQQGVMRLPIDRAFAVTGFGTVVTGTLLAGSVAVGETLEIHPLKTRVRVRGLQARHSAVEKASAGQRLAVNLAGIDHQDLKRGYVLAAAGALGGTRLLDVQLNWLHQDDLPNPRELFVLHTGTAETSAKITLYPGGSARVRLSEELIALPGDRIVIRRPSPAETLGGGIVLDAFPPRRLGRSKTLTRLESLRTATLPQRIELLLTEAPIGLDVADLVRMTGASRKQLETAIAGTPAIKVTSDERAVTQAWIESRRRSLLTWLRDFHKANPNAPGGQLAAARLGLNPALALLVFKDFDAIRVQGETVALATHKAEFSPQELAALQKMEQTFRAAAFQPPPLTEVTTSVGLDAKKARSLLESLVKNNRLVRLPDDLIFHADVIAHIKTSLGQHKGRKFSVAEFKSWTNISRKFAIPLLEYLDQQRVTKREGDARIVL